MASLINAITTGPGGLISTGDSSGVLALQTSGTTALTIGSSQNVGIGTTSPSNKLTVSTSGNYDGIAVNNSSTTTATRIAMNNDASQYLQLDVGSSGRSSYGTAGPNTVSITSGATGGFNIGTDNAYPLAFYTNLNERVRITSTGSLLVGTTSTSGSTSNYNPVLAGVFKSFSGNTSVVPTNTYTTLFTDTGNFGSYIVTVWLYANDVANYQSVLIVSTQPGTSTKVNVLVSSGLLAFQMSGYSLQCAQNSGASQTIYYSATRIAG
jgi:hypothetical protein